MAAARGPPRAGAARAMICAAFRGGTPCSAWWIGAIAFVVLAAVVIVFNDLVAARNQVRAAWSDIDVQLTRRHDLVPQLVAAVQGYASYERATLTTLTELRARAVSAASLADKAEVEGELAQADRPHPRACRNAIRI